MATVSCTFRFADGDEVSAKVTMPTAYPDALSEAVHTCSAMFREALVTGMVAQADDDDDD